MDCIILFLFVLSIGTIFDVVNEINQNGGEAFPIKCDVRSDADIQNTVDACIKHCGKIDVAVYNAGEHLNLTQNSCDWNAMKLFTSPQLSTEH